MIEVDAVYCPAPGQVDEARLSLPAGATLRSALAAWGVAERHALDVETLVCGVWGRRQPLDHPLRARDRIEIYRPLQCDPKEARRLRYRQRKERTAAQSQAPLSGSPPR